MTYDFDKYIQAQTPIYENVLVELKQARKRSHWMWFIFPQLDGLGRSEIAKQYAIMDINHARAYLQHPILSARLAECTQSMIAIENKTATEILGSPDDMKFQSSMTLFNQADPDNGLFQQALKRFFQGELDRKTLTILAKTQ